MALASSLHQTYIPLPSSNSGDRHADDEVVLKPVPIYIISHESQLPDPFLYPSPKNELVVGLDCDGVDLGRYGALCIVQLAFPDAIYLVDAIHGGKELINACKPALESIFITKVILDCKRDSEALYYQFGIKLHNVMDTQIAYYLIEEQMGQKSAPDGHISFVRLLGDPCYCGISYVEKKEIRSLLKEDPQFWAYRPLSDLMVRAAAADVRFLPYVFHKMMEKLSEQSLWRLAVRGSLCCRCFCISDNELIGQQFLLFQISSMWNEIHWKTRFSPCLMCHPGKWDVLLVEKDPQFCQSKNHASFHHWTPEAGKESRSHVEGPDVVTCEITLFAAPGSQSFYIYNTRLTQAKQTRVKPISLLLLTFILIFHAILSHIGWGC